MQGIYTHIPETNYVPREYSVAAILLFLFMVFRNNRIAATLYSTYYYYYYYYACFHIYAGYLHLYTETHHVSRVYSVAAVLYLQFVLHVMLFHL